MAGRPVHTFEVIRSEQLTPHMIRVVLGGKGFDTFVPSEFTDSYVKIVIVRDDVDVDALPRPLTLDSFNELPEEHRPVVRTYTVRHADPRPSRDRDRLRGARRARRSRAVGGLTAARPTGVSHGTQRGVRTGPGRRLAPAGRRRSRPARD